MPSLRARGLPCSRDDVDRFISKVDANGDGIDEDEFRHFAAAQDSWLKKFFGIGPADLTMPASKLIYPLSPFGIFWLLTTAVFLG